MIYANGRICHKAGTYRPVTIALPVDTFIDAVHHLRSFASGIAGGSSGLVTFWIESLSRNRPRGSEPIAIDNLERVSDIVVKLLKDQQE